MGASLYSIKKVPLGKHITIMMFGNIAKGAGRSSTKAFMSFLSIAVGSIVELNTQLIISKRTGYMSIPERDLILEELSNIRRITL